MVKDYCVELKQSHQHDGEVFLRYKLAKPVLRTGNQKQALRKNYTWTSASSPSAEQDNVGVVPRNPESVTSSTVSPMESTKVAFTKDTMMYESNSSKRKNDKYVRVDNGTAKISNSQIEILIQ